jgi:hypothetical protein
VLARTIKHDRPREGGVCVHGLGAIVHARAITRPRAWV